MDPMTKLSNEINYILLRYPPKCEIPRLSDKAIKALELLREKYLAVKK